MKVIAFLGSPRIEGNTDLMLKEAVRAIEGQGHSVAQFRLNFMTMKPCQDCGGCVKTGTCVIDDDMAGIYEAIRGADRVILASPIFFFGLSAQAKIMIDRCQAFWCEKYLLNRSIPAGPTGRKGLLLFVGGMKKDVGMECAETTARAFLRTISVPSHNTLRFTDVDAKGAIMEHPTAMQEISAAAVRFVSER